MARCKNVSGLTGGSGGTLEAMGETMHPVGSQL